MNYSSIESHCPEVLQAVNRLALAIRDRRREVSRTRLDQEAKSDAENLETMRKVVEAIDQRFDTWMESVEFDHIAGSTWRAMLKQHLKRVERLRRITSTDRRSPLCLQALGK